MVIRLNVGCGAVMGGRHGAGPTGGRHGAGLTSSPVLPTSYVKFEIRLGTGHDRDVT